MQTILPFPVRWVRGSWFVAVALLAGVLGPAVRAEAAPATSDRKGCADHPLLSRISGYFITRCDQRDFEAREFVTSKTSKQRVEGRSSWYRYEPGAGTEKAGELRIIRNYTNAIKEIGGTVVYDNDSNRVTLKVAKAGKEYWIAIAPLGTLYYDVFTIEKSDMVQDVVANAAALFQGVATTGHIAVYGILFDTGKSDIKPESAAAIAEIAKLMTENPALKIHLVGHTDNQGTVSGNMALSQSRAEAVVNALVKKHGVAAARLSAHGAGPYAPVATNRTEEGRAKNRRVELVEQ